MSNFAPCLACQRHVRVSDAQCPFCGAAHAGRRARSGQTPVGAKRAVLFALGSLAAACGDDATQPQPIYGAPVATSAPSPQPLYGAIPAPSDTVPAATSAPSPQPLYGAIPAPSASGTGSQADGNADSGGQDSAPSDDASAVDAGADAGGAPEAGPSPDDSISVQPLYGAVPQPVYGAPPTAQQ